MTYLGRTFLALVSIATLLAACSDEPPATAPDQSSKHAVRIMAVEPTQSSNNDKLFQLATLREGKGLGLAQRTEQMAKLIATWPADTAIEICKSGEHCMEQDKTWTGKFFVHCLSESCDPQVTYTWELKTPPPGTTVSFSPAVTTIEQETTMSIELDNDAETGVYDASVAARPSGPDLPFKFHTQCSWGLGTCPYVEIRDLLTSGWPSVSVSAAGEQGRLIGQRMHLKVEKKLGTGEHVFTPEEHGWLIQWDGPGDLVAGYDIEATQLQLEPWPQGVGSKDTLRYYYVRPNQYVVWAQIDLSYNQDEARIRVLTKAVYNVDGPTVTLMTSETDSVITGPVDTFDYHYRFGRVPPPGITWVFAASVPSSDPGGYVAGTQIVTGLIRRLDRFGILRQNWTSVGNTLDGCPLYAPHVRQSDGAYIWTSNDTPYGLFQVTDSSGSMDLDFKMYFMYRPAGFDNIWVPLGRLDWFFEASVARVGSPGEWETVSSGASANPSGTALSEFPTWVDVFASPQSCTNVPASFVDGRNEHIARSTLHEQEVLP